MLAARMTSHALLLRAAKTLSPLQPRRVLVALGAHLSARSLTRASQALAGLEQGKWLAVSGRPVPNLPDRFALFDEAVRRVRGPRPLYLEFGVYRGRTLRYWASRLASPEARLVGFDSFEGLPEDWSPDAREGTFSVGEPPELADPRVSFVVGWFDDTLPGWSPPAHDQLVVNVDCDLYSSTTVVLDWLTPHLGAGDLVYFDDMINRDHQWRAFSEWVDHLGPDRSIAPVATARWGHHLLVEVAEGPGAPSDPRGTPR
jgi:hypothetical protein